MAGLVSKPGMAHASFGQSVPSQYDQTWFRNLIKTGMQLADVRNAVGTNGITVSGNITQYGTIGLQAPLSFNINVDDGNAITVNEVATLVDGTTTLVQKYNGVSAAWLGGGLASFTDATSPWDYGIDVQTANAPSGAAKLRLAINNLTRLALYSPPSTVAQVDSSWGGVMSAMDFGNCSMFTYSQAAGNALYAVANGYYNGSVYVAKTASGAAQWNLHPTNGFTVLTAPAVTAGSTLTFTRAMNVAIGGGVTIDGPSNGVSATVNIPGDGVSNTIVSYGGVSQAAFKAQSVGATLLGLNMNSSGANYQFYISNNVGNCWSLCYNLGNDIIRVYPSGAILINAPTIAGNVALQVNAVFGTHSTKIADSSNNSYNAGFLEVPILTHNANYTCVLSDSGCAIETSTAAITYTIPANASVAYPVGTVLTFENLSAGNITISINSDTMYQAGTGSTGSRTLASYGLATAHKISSTVWLISGTGLS